MFIVVEAFNVSSVLTTVAAYVKHVADAVNGQCQRALRQQLLKYGQAAAAALETPVVIVIKMRSEEPAADTLKKP